MKFTHQIKTVLRVFPIVMTCVSLAAATYIALFWEVDTSSGAKLIWQLALCSFLCSLSALFSEKKHELSKRAFLLRTALFFLYTNVVVMLCGFAFEWFHAEDWRMLLGMEATIVVVFVIICFLFYRRSKKRCGARKRAPAKA